MYCMWWRTTHLPNVIAVVVGMYGKRVWVVVVGVCGKRIQELYKIF